MRSDSLFRPAAVSPVPAFKMKLRSIGRKVFKLAMLALFAPIIAPLVIVALVLYFLNRIVIYLLVWVLWLPNGKDVLYVSSDSPIWKEYMETRSFHW
jgi:hypothetical protein